MTNRPSIAFGFNIVFFTYLCVDFLVSLLFTPKSDEKVPWDAIYDAFPVLSVLLAVLIGLVLLLWGAKMVQLFWNRLISDIFQLREINLQEALALVLVLAITIT